jgi:predicted enzyme related to lactoylglutathione lyase
MHTKEREKEGPVNYVNTSNIDTSIKKFKKAGGKITQPKVEIPGMGWSAKGVDPEGNQVGLFQPGRMAQPKAKRK